GGGTAGARTTPSIAGPPPATGFAQRLGAAPGSTLPSAFLAAPASAFDAPLAAMQFRGLYVSDLGVHAGTGGAWLLSPREFEPIAKLSAGMEVPDGEWIDRAGNYYVANANGGNVTEYAPGSRRLTCMYPGASDPTNVKTDADGNVYVIDWNIGQRGSIDVYKQCSKTIVKKFTFGRGAPTDVAFDGAGNLFVMYLVTSTESGALEEFRAGSKTPVALGATVSFPGGLLIDRNRNLIAADQGTAGKRTGSIDIIAPPYAKAVPLVSRLAQPVWLSLNQRQDVLFASSFDHNDPKVWVFNYPSGRLRTTIGSANGLVVPLGVAADPDDTF
ncbi:MAG: hypothetical protein IAI50_19745, partial [Candidatus Eremiobacteraeota bacterium]|nr:hypothetical protein [Candidatus Eremiobacteraeota bacterium]